MASDELRQVDSGQLRPRELTEIHGVLLGEQLAQLERPHAVSVLQHELKGQGVLFGQGVLMLERSL